jgi:hypothetical protein
MLALDHLTVIAPSLADGVMHVRECLDIDVPFGTRHTFMGTHNHRLRLGGSIYLEIIAVDPGGLAPPPRARWFGLDNTEQVVKDWCEGRRLRGWVANTSVLDQILATHGGTFGRRVELPTADPTFAFAIPDDGSLPLDGAAPSLIDHYGDASYIDALPDLGARLATFVLEHPDPSGVEALYKALAIRNAPTLQPGTVMKYRASIQTPRGLRQLT